MSYFVGGDEGSHWPNFLNIFNVDRCRIKSVFIALFPQLKFSSQVSS